MNCSGAWNGACSKDGKEEERQQKGSKSRRSMTEEEQQQGSRSSSKQEYSGSHWRAGATAALVAVVDFCLKPPAKPGGFGSPTGRYSGRTKVSKLAGAELPPPLLTSSAPSTRGQTGWASNLMIDKLQQR